MPALTPNPQGFQIEVEKDTTTPPGAGASILPLVVIGHCTNTVDAPVNVPVPIATPNAAKLAGGMGPAVELAACALDDNGDVGLVHLVNVTATNPASYGAITQAWANDTPPLVVAEPGTLPSDNLDVSILWTAGGVPGTAGAKYRISIDNALHYFAEQALGTATLITAPNGGGQYRLVAPLATIVARAADIRTKFLAHAAEFGTVHTIVDPNSPYTITTPIDLATLYTCCTNLRTSALTHVAVLGTVHGAVDTAAQALITALTTPTTQYEAQVFLAAFATAFFGDGATLNSGHSRRTTSTIHLAVDMVNILAAMGTLGTITVNDEFHLSTIAPSPDATELVAAIDSLRSYTGEFATLTFAATIPAAYINTVYAALKELWKFNKFADIVASFDVPGLTENTTAYALRLADLFGIEAVDVRMCSGATYHQSALINTSDGLATPRRPTSWWVSMAKARNEPQAILQHIAPQNGVRIRDSRGRLLPGCLDEQSGLLYSVLNRTIGTKTDLTRDPNGGVFVTQDLVLYEADTDWILGPYTSVMNFALRAGTPVIVAASTNPNGFAGFGQDIIDGLIDDVMGVLKPSLVDEGRAKAVRVFITDTNGGFISWTVEATVNDYIINGVKITAKIRRTV
jgi:hypothetical protein